MEVNKKELKEQEIRTLFITPALQQPVGFRAAAPPAKMREFSSFVLVFLKQFRLLLSQKIF